MASSPATSRIEELERKFNENPRRYFAPLANEYRKAGNLEQAIAICRTYVPQQPAHMSGQIVFGQALYEAGEFDEARTVLEAALALDPENLIALRHLGDIARARGEVATARTWYQRVLDADPRNADALAAITMLPPASPSAAPPAPAPVSPPPSITEAAAPTPVTSPIVSPAAPPMAPTAAEDAFEASFSEPPISDMGGYETPSYGAETGDIASVAHAVGDHAIGEDASGDDVMAEPPAPEPPPADPFASVEPENPEPDTIDATPVEFVTETMAELYLQQGFRQEALDVYQKLLKKNPEDNMLRARVQQLEAEMAPSEEQAPMVSGYDASLTMASEEEVSFSEPSPIEPSPSAAAPMFESESDPFADRFFNTDLPGVARPAASSIRAFLGGLAQRRVTKAGGVTPISVPATRPSGATPAARPSGPAPLDAMAIAATEYEYEQPTDFTIAGSSQFHETTSLDAMFPPADVPLQDEAAASTLSEAYGGGEEAPSEPVASHDVGAEAVVDAAPVVSHDSAPPQESEPLGLLPTEPAVRPAKDEISLDRIFGEEEDGASSANITNVDLGFDQLFGTMAPNLDVSKINGAPSPNDVPPAINNNSNNVSNINSDDLSDGLDAEQFTDWLSGLKEEVKVALLNGPNLNLLGTREPAIYGRATLADIEAHLRNVARELGEVTLDCVQHNSEGALIDAIHALRGTHAGAIINAGAYSHTSLAIRDAFASVAVPYVEVHLTNIYAREPERRHSMLAAGARAVLVGFGAHGYELALRGLVTMLRGESLGESAESGRG